MYLQFCPWNLGVMFERGVLKWNTNFRLERYVRKNGTTFSDVPVLPEIFRCNDPKRRFPFTFQPDFPELFVNDKLPFSPVWPAHTVHTYPMKTSLKMQCRVFTDKLAS